MTIFGIAGSMALMLVGFGIRDSVSDIVHLQYTNLQHYDATIISDDDATDTEREALIESLDKNESLDHYTKIRLSKEKKVNTLGLSQTPLLKRCFH